MARVTIEDVAREADVSIATVSRYINGRSGAMSPATRDRLEAVIERLGYVPNSAAQSLKTGRTNLIGIAVAEISHVYWSTILAGVETACQRRGYGVLISSANNDAEIQSRYVSMFVKQQADGILLNPAVADRKTIAAWSKLPLPVIMLDRTFPELDRPLVAVDNVHGAALAARHLLELGHRRLGVISWELRHLSNREERIAGFSGAVREAGLELPSARIRFARESWDDGVRETIELFGRPDRPTAIFSCNLDLNLQVLSGLRQLGLRVPEDVSVVGFDDPPWNPLLEPPLTTIAPPTRQIGETAAGLLIDAIERGVRPHRENHRLKPTLVVRASTGAPPI